MDVHDQDQSSVGGVDLLQLIARNSKSLVGWPLLVGAVAFGATYLVQPVFTARSVFLPPQQPQSATAVAMQSLGALASLTGASVGARTPTDQYIALMQSVNVANRVIEARQLKAVYGTANGDDTRRALAAYVRIDAGKRSGLMSVEVDDTDPVRAASVANEYVEQLRRLTSELAVTEAQQRRAFFEQQLQKARDRLASAQGALQASGINEGALRAEPKAAADAYASVKARVMEAQVRLDALLRIATPQSAEVKLAHANLDALKSQLGRMEVAPKGEPSGDYLSTYREFKYQELLFDMFAKQFEMAKLDEAREGAVIQVVDVAQPPERPSRPQRVRTVMMAATGALGLVIAHLLVTTAWRKRKVMENCSRQMTPANTIGGS
ncbi:MAG: lipopolysaccharide biosynthesis protein [Aquabacterium sp.]|uniref:lipopolysaccharide biosynthesis protein n=1 Tax=Aquabacterium sp. TaxID=1872578 RepID=UPI0025B89882|nr:lipopolysaccharide biosynthesis protein [Aquabacterium sp.]MBI5925029.1 lipopolysaccharide biosynthesis protein [Aquabacterium sp.]